MIKRTLILALLLSTVPPAGLAQDYPRKPIRLVMPNARRSIDFLGRIVAQKLGEALGEQLVVGARRGGRRDRHGEREDRRAGRLHAAQSTAAMSIVRHLRSNPVTVKDFAFISTYASRPMRWW
jgi:tripartite-type tricarboxylate transporter receptor subunit TctC